jgi:hypothetical protein
MYESLKTFGGKLSVFVTWPGTFGGGLSVFVTWPGTVREIPVYIQRRSVKLWGERFSPVFA